MQGLLPNEDGLKYGHRPNPEQLIELKLSRVKGKQFRYIYPMSKKYRRYLKNSTVEWNLNHPKHSDLEWKIKLPGETSYTETDKMPFDLTKDMEYNKKNIKTYKSETNLNTFFS